MTTYNPIKKVGLVSNIPPPTSYQWEREDLSNSSAGRTEDGKMHKNRIGYKISLTLSWENIETAVASLILKAFSPEYIDVTYLDPEEGTYSTKTFYVGNRTAPLYNCQCNLWSNISFKIIEQ